MDGNLLKQMTLDHMRRMERDQHKFLATRGAQHSSSTASSASSAPSAHAASGRGANLNDVSRPRRGRPRSAATAMSAAEYAAVSEKPVDSQCMYSLVEALRNAYGKSMTARELWALTGIDLETRPELKLEMRRNLKVSCDEESGTYAYKPMYVVHNLEELLVLLTTTPDGIPLEDLKDSYPQIEADAREAAMNGKLIAIINTEKKKEILYPKDPAFDHLIPISPEVQDQWHNTPIPATDVDIENSLKRAGLLDEGSQRIVVTAAKKLPTKPKAKRGRKVAKITNIHQIEGLDVKKEIELRREQS
ncbi:transcription initiation factor TFIIE subunit beta [Pelomyxa schiedti]|nr:transcription initiation factor TFIIE subunit beta [Pelomyxa schiedti]